MTKDPLGFLESTPPYAGVIQKNLYVLEGPDGSGRSTQMQLLKQNLNPKDYHTCFEPTDSELGQWIRWALKQTLDDDQNKNELRYSAQTLSFVFSADRQDHWDKPGGLKDQLDQGLKVICDRYVFSSLVYQGILGAGQSSFWLNQNFPLPEKVFYFDLPIQVSFQRAQKRANSDQMEKWEIQKQVQQSYIQIQKYYCRNYPIEWICIDAQQSQECVFQQIMSYLD